VVLWQITPRHLLWDPEKKSSPLFNEALKSRFWRPPQKGQIGERIPTKIPGFLKTLGKKHARLIWRNFHHGKFKKVTRKKSKGLPNRKG